jgi:hypothetical protein
VVCEGQCVPSVCGINSSGVVKQVGMSGCALAFVWGLYAHCTQVLSCGVVL